MLTQYLDFIGIEQDYQKVGSSVGYSKEMVRAFYQSTILSSKSAVHAAGEIIPVTATLHLVNFTIVIENRPGMVF